MIENKDLELADLGARQLESCLKGLKLQWDRCGGQYRVAEFFMIEYAVAAIG